MDFLSIFLYFLILVGFTYSVYFGDKTKKKDITPFKREYYYRMFFVSLGFACFVGTFLIYFTKQSLLVAIIPFGILAFILFLISFLSWLNGDLFITKN
jgi:hypothetical protein